MLSSRKINASRLVVTTHITVNFSLSFDVRILHLVTWGSIIYLTLTQFFSRLYERILAVNAY